MEKTVAGRCQASTLQLNAGRFQFGATQVFQFGSLANSPRMYRAFTLGANAVNVITNLMQSTDFNSPSLGSDPSIKFPLSRAHSLLIKDK